jgi:hypothetical protein
MRDISPQRRGERRVRKEERFHHEGHEVHEFENILIAKSEFRNSKTTFVFLWRTISSFVNFVSYKFPRIHSGQAFVVNVFFAAYSVPPW